MKASSSLGGVGTGAPHGFVAKRDGLRSPCDLEACLRGRGGVFPAQTVNASRSGVLLVIGGAVDGAEAYAWADRVFRTGADVRFPEPGLAVRADLARVVAGLDGALQIAFRFRANLGPEACRRLGIEARDDGEPSF